MTTTFKIIFFALFALFTLIPTFSLAGVDKSGVRPSVVSLPSGPGSVEGLGESFEPQLNSGTTSYAVALKLPPGRAGFQPDFSLRYNGVFGPGWSIPVPFIQRQTDKGLPQYDDTDTFIESGGEELVPVGGGVYRHENEGVFVRYEKSGEGWIATNPSGVKYTYGPDQDSQIKNGTNIFRWLIREIRDTNGNTVLFQYLKLDSGPRQYLSEIAYNNHKIRFEYESRPDALADYRPTFRLETAFRCKSVSMKTKDRLIRRYDFGLGVMTASVDLNNHTTTYSYDTFGRLIHIIKPPDAGHTVEYEYMLAHEINEGRRINWVETRQRDNSADDGFLHSRSFYDGMGRKIMTRTEGEETGQIVVTDTLQFNARKQPWKTYLPYFETGTLDFAEPSFNTGFTEHFYDAMGREIQVNQPAGPDGILFSTTEYQPLARIVRDEEQTNPESVHSGCGMKYVEDGLQDKDGKGRLREVYEIVRLSDIGESVSGPVSWKTAYAYDLLDKLVKITDSQNNQKFMEYDGLGRKTFMNDPDRGTMVYEYDDAGNLLRTTDAKGQVIRYEYDGVNRLTAEYYGETRTTPDVAYHYDEPYGPVEKGEFWSACSPKRIADAILQEDGSLTDCDLNQDGRLDVADVVRAATGEGETVTAQNLRGFLSWVEDASGEEHNSYDARGRVEWVVRRIAGNSGLHNFYTAMDYDSMDRVTTLTYHLETM